MTVAGMDPNYENMLIRGTEGILQVVVVCFP